MFDWVNFLDRRGIYYATSGPNVSRGNVAVKCPFCGTADPSEHMSIAIDGSGWRCFRNPGAHSGKNPIRLIRALIGCSYDEAFRIVGAPRPLPNDPAMVVKSQLVKPIQIPHHKLSLPSEFKPFADLPSARLFINYLIKRGFTMKQIMRFTDRYNLRYCTRGSYKGRIIFPIEYRNELVGWTGRTVYPSETLRYKTLSPNLGKQNSDGYPSAIGANTNYLLWYDQLLISAANTICICEGPFDALRLRVLGRSQGIEATCLFTSTPSEQQIELLHDLLPRFKHRVILLDQGTLPIALRLANELAGLGVQIGRLPTSRKDPGELRDVAELNYAVRKYD